MEKAIVVMIVILIVIVGVALLGFAEDCGVEIGQDNATIEQVKDVWAELTAPVSLDWDTAAK
jgi:uncharacterized protein YxeA